MCLALVWHTSNDRTVDLHVDHDSHDNEGDEDYHLDNVHDFFLEHALGVTLRSSMHERRRLAHLRVQPRALDQCQALARAHHKPAQEDLVVVFVRHFARDGLARER